MSSSGVPKSVIKQNIEKVQQVLEFNAKAGRTANDVARVPLLTRKALDKQMEKLAQIQTQNPDEKYEKLEFIAGGSSGQVYKVRVKENRDLAAVKISKVEEYKYIKQEIAFHAMCHHENIVNYKETFIWESEIWIVMDLVDGGTLTDICGYPEVENENEEESWDIEEWPEMFIAYVMREVLQALAYMHKMHLIHRDIKSDNMLLSKDGRLKLADFGFATALTEENQKLKNNEVGSPYWLAPEVIAAEEYDESCDIWSLGITAMELVLHEPPHFHHNESVNAFLNIVLLPPPTPLNIYRASLGTFDEFHEQVYLDKRHPNPDHYSEAFLDFVDKMLHKKPEKRLSAEQLLEHEFIGKASTKEEFVEWAQHVSEELYKQLI